MWVASGLATVAGWGVLIMSSMILGGEGGRMGAAVLGEVRLGLWCVYI